MTAPNAGLVVVTLTSDEFQAILRDEIERALGAQASAQRQTKSRLSTIEIAAALGVSRAKIHELAESGALPFLWVGDCRRFDLDECVEALKSAAPPAKRRAGPGRGKRK